MITYREAELDMVAMPHAYKIGKFAATRARLAGETRRSKYLCFAHGALTGDWGVIAALEAIKQRCGYAVWYDHVEPEDSGPIFQACR